MQRCSTPSYSRPYAADLCPGGRLRAAPSRNRAWRALSGPWQIASTQFMIYLVVPARALKTFARFNMPLELGMAMARRLLEPSAEHDWLVLIPKGHPYARFVSDLAAYDPVVHDGSVPSVIIAVMSWLATRPDAIPTATPLEVLALLPTFQSRRQALNEAWGGLPP